jgi:hypothetical protein
VSNSLVLLKYFFVIYIYIFYTLCVVIQIIYMYGNYTIFYILYFIFFYSLHPHKLFFNFLM